MIVTGASRGLGRAIAIACAAEGAAVVVAARSEEVWDERLPGTIYETVAAIEADGGRAVAVRCDVSQDEDLVDVVTAARSELGRIDVLINNATLTAPGRPGAAKRTPTSVAARGGSHRPAILDVPVAGYERHFRVGAFAAYRLMQLVVPDMLSAGRGSIVNISSDASRLPGPGPYSHRTRSAPMAYGGNKAALEHLTQATAFELRDHGVAVNALLPSCPILTPGLAAVSPTAKERSGDTPENFAEAAIRLAVLSPSEMTGACAYHVDILRPDLEPRGWLGP